MTVAGIPLQDFPPLSYQTLTVKMEIIAEEHAPRRDDIVIVRSQEELKTPYISSGYMTIVMPQFDRSICPEHKTGQIMS
ncbi:hypothetical protein [Bifidobacterium vespertilionis]|uniref:Uncharacterized protein n=1 Tax=Bifidobacterium vespertilionis TaxID=2562524 RepID=A0A5J5DYW9_9BIFI|nr:hypothetical protein [Bifidobacterium vespertilionis]KAA8822094.1 hypothetical protein EMO90_02570 [Bifidobacterium vespertilionis]KAA8824543.1 hypothetical protein EM848_01655 [Bifidobacterium vespertilionis]